MQQYDRQMFGDGSVQGSCSSTFGLRDSAAACCTCGEQDGQSEWTFFGSSSRGIGTWERRYSNALGYHLIATRKIREGEIVLDELPLISGESADHGNNDPGWAKSCLREFCSAPRTTQMVVLSMFAGESGTLEYDEVYADAQREVALCAKLPWRVAASRLSDTALTRVCLIFQLNGYCFRGNRIALFEAGCTMAHSCDSNVRYSSQTHSGLGSFVARRDVALGECLTTNYLGDYSGFMSTPARRQALLSSKCFSCRCSRCTDPSDPLRHVPCPGCHPRTRGEHELPVSVALSAAGVPVNYAVPCGSEADASWWCKHCSSSWSVEQVLPGPASQGVASGRAWERVVEQHVLNLDKRWMMLNEAGKAGKSAQRRKDAAEALAVHEEVTSLHGLVARSVGSRHWTTRRLVEMLSGREASSTPGSGYR